MHGDEDKRREIRQKGEGTHTNKRQRGGVGGPTSEGDSGRGGDETNFLFRRRAENEQIFLAGSDYLLKLLYLQIIG